MNMGCQLGGAISSSLTPAIAERSGWTSSFAVAAVLILAGSAAWLLVDRKPSLSEMEQQLIVH
jgi:ACS family glucarate transporter-like MFS transporter